MPTLDEWHELLAAAGEPDFVKEEKKMPDAEALLAEAEEVVQKLMDIAEIAMPDTFFTSDSRTTAARAWQKKLRAYKKKGDRT